MGTDLIARMVTVLDDRAEHLTRETDYYTGVSPRAVLAAASVPQYRQIVDQSRTPWAGLVIDQAAERMRVAGFRVVTPGESSDVDSDDLAWDIWMASQADVYSRSAFTEMLLHGIAYTLVEPGPDLPVISFEGPDTAVTLSAPGGRATIAGMKRWTVGDLDVAVLWTLDAAPAVWVRSRSRGGGWEPDTGQLSGIATIPGIVPLYPMRNRPDLAGGYASDLDGLYPTIDRATQAVADRVTAQLYASVKVRYLIGAELPVDEDGNPTDASLRLATDRLLIVENPDAKAGQFEASDLRQFIEVAKSDVAALAALARLPSYLLAGDLTNLSREALETLSEGLVARVRHRQVWAGAALSQAMRTALRLAGDTRVNDPRTRVEPIWEDVLDPAIGVTAQAAAALVGGGILTATGAQDLVMGWGPTEREKLAQYARKDALDQQGVANIAALFAEPAPEGA